MRTQLTTLVLVLVLVLAASTLSCSSSSEKPGEPVAEQGQVLELGIPNAKQVEEHLYSSGKLSPEQLAALPAAGIGRVVCLQPASESGTGWEEAQAPELGLSFARIPIAGEADFNEENARRLAAELDAEPHQPTLVYCASGNRVGALLALEAYFVEGLEPKAALQRGKQAGMTRAEPAVRKLLGLTAAD